MRMPILLLCIALLVGCSRKPVTEPQQTETAAAAPQAESARGDLVFPADLRTLEKPASIAKRRTSPPVDPNVGIVLPKDAFRAIAVQADGKVVVAGSTYNGRNDDGWIRRFLRDGKVDPKFGGDSGIREAFGDEDDQYFGIGIQKDGRIVAAGSSSLGRRNFFILARYTSAGELDEAFATNGKAVTEIGTLRDAARCMVIQSDGRILVAGSSSNDADGGDNDFAVARYTKGGLLDPTFGQGGKTLVDFEDGDDIANCIALQNDGKVIIAGSSEKSGKRVLALARFNPDGRRDLTFGKRGKVVTEFEGRNGIATGVSLLSDGRIIIVGSVYSGGRRDVFLVRYHPNGGIDEKFGEGGKVITKIGNSADANGVVIQHDGKMIVAGAATDGHRYGFCVLRYLESGKLDVRLETPGNVRAASEKGDDFGYAVALDRNGDILVAGVSMDVKGAKALLVRYKGN